MPQFREVGGFILFFGLASDKRELRWSAINDMTAWTAGNELDSASAARYRQCHPKTL
jgi:hypothetical protein